MLHASRGHWLERRRVHVALATLALPLWLASCSDAGDDDASSATSGGAGTTSAGAGGGAGTMQVAGAPSTAGTSSSSAGHGTAGTSSNAGRGGAGGAGAGGGATGGSSNGGTAGNAGASAGSAGCMGPDDCMPGDYCVYSEESQGKPICQAEPEVGPLANCCFSCDSFPVCTLCWREEDCPATYICVHSTGQPSDGPGGCRLAE